VLIIDTAGRLHMTMKPDGGAARRIRSAVKPQEILLVVDCHDRPGRGQCGASFNEKLGIDGVILTKLDSDTRGGAALSVRR
jgi:signal recognition particle subunit SRP54